MTTTTSKQPTKAGVVIVARETWGLAIVANPNRTVCLVALDGDEPAWKNTKTWTGKWDGNGKPIYKGTHKSVETYNPHQSGGIYNARSIIMLDATPRTWQEACDVASKCAPGNHVYTRSVDDMRAELDAVLAGKATWARWAADKYTANWCDREFIAKCSDEELAAALSMDAEDSCYEAMLALRGKYAE